MLLLVVVFCACGRGVKSQKLESMGGGGKNAKFVKISPPNPTPHPQLRNNDRFYCKMVDQALDSMQPILRAFMVR